MTRILLVCLVLAGCATPPVVQQLNEHDYKITGKLDKPEYDEIIRIVHSHPQEPVNFYVNSGGGTSSDLLEAMDAVHDHGMVHWYTIHCDSACGVMALSTGHAQGGIRLHSFYQRKYGHIRAAPEYNQRVLERLGRYGYDVNYLDHMFLTVEQLWDVHLEDGKIVD